MPQISVIPVTQKLVLFGFIATFPSIDSTKAIFEFVLAFWYWAHVEMLPVLPTAVLPTAVLPTAVLAAAVLPAAVLAAAVLPAAVLPAAVEGVLLHPPAATASATTPDATSAPLAFDLRLRLRCSPRGNWFTTA